MSGHPQFDEDLDLYVLGALDPGEALAIESHTEACASCKAKVAEARGRMALLALAADPVQPPERVKQRLMMRVKEISPAQSAPATRSSPPKLFRPSMVAWTLAAAAIACAIVLGVRNDQLKKELNAQMAQEQAQAQTIARSRAILDMLTAPDTLAVTLTAASAKPLPEGKVYYRPNSGLLFYASNLPAAPAGRTYQLWLVPAEGSPISAGIFQTDPRGDASIVLPPLPAGVAAKAFAVTVEAAGGVSQPTGPKVLIGTS